MWGRYLLVIALFYLVQGAVVLFALSGIHVIMSGGLLQWDAELYADIVRDGYSRMYTAFFPLFPMVWKITGLGSIGISLLNALLFIISLAWISVELKARLYHVLLVAATPTFIFFFIPYSESLFFLGSVMLLVGFLRKHQLLLLAGLLVCSFARPTASVFIPAIILTEWLCRENNRMALVIMAKQIVAVAIGLLLALFVHQWHTGDWFTFFEVQAEFWDNSLRIPSFPLRSWAGMKVTMLDGTALVVSIVCGLALLQKLRPNFRNFKVTAPRYLIFSLLYLLGIGLVVILFRGGELFSLNRFVFATAFFVVVAFYFLKQAFSTKALYFPAVLFVYWLLFNSYVHIQTFLKYLLITLFISLPVLMQVRLKKKWINELATVLFFAGLAALQIYFFARYLNSEWVG